VQTYDWSTDSISKIRFNPSEQNILACVGLDRSIALYDIRAQTPIKKNQLKNKSGCICWNPMEPINFTVGNDDSNLYTFDMRKLDTVRKIHKDHIGAVMDIDYSPTGTEFVSGSYDKTVRIFRENEGKSKEVYHGKRMQKVFCVCYTMDSKYILSGSEDMNIRIWKSNASDPVGMVTDRHKRRINYRQKLKDKFQYNKEIKRIARHRHLPKYIFNAKKRRQVQKESQHRKQKNMEIHNPGQSKHVNERKDGILDLIE